MLLLNILENSRHFITKKIVEWHIRTEVYKNTLNTIALDLLNNIKLFIVIHYILVKNFRITSVLQITDK